MSSDNEFTKEEWIKILDAPFHIGIAVSDVDFSPKSSRVEFHEILKTCADAEVKYASNQLIVAVLKNVGGTVVTPGSNEGDQLDLIYHLEKINSILKKKNPGRESEEYKQFLYEIAERVAKSYGEGFLGLGNKVSESEKGLLDKIKSALELK